MSTANVKFGIPWCPRHTMFFYREGTTLYRASKFIGYDKDDTIRMTAFWLEAFNPPGSVTASLPLLRSKSFLGTDSLIISRRASSWFWRLYTKFRLSFTHKVILMINDWIPLTLTRHDHQGLGSLPLVFDEDVGYGAAGHVHRNETSGIVVKIYHDDKDAASEFHLLSLAASLGMKLVPAVRGLFCGYGFSAVIMDDGGRNIQSLHQLDQSQMYTSCSRIASTDSR